MRHDKQQTVSLGEKGKEASFQGLGDNVKIAKYVHLTGKCELCSYLV